MSTLDTCCVFMKELAFKHRVPAEMHISPLNPVRIEVHRSALTEDQEDEICEDAKKRGLEVDVGNAWISFHG